MGHTTTLENVIENNVSSFETRIDTIKTDFAKINGYTENTTTLKQVISDGWNAQRIPLGKLGIHGFIANKGYIGLLLAYSNFFINAPETELAGSVEQRFQKRIGDYIENLTPNAEWIYNYKRFEDEKKNITRVCDLLFENGVLVEKTYYI